MLINRNNSTNRGSHQSFMRQENRVGILTTGTAKVTNSTHIMVRTSVTSWMSSLGANKRKLRECGMRIKEGPKSSILADSKVNTSRIGERRLHRRRRRESVTRKTIIKSSGRNGKINIKGFMILWTLQTSWETSWGCFWYSLALYSYSEHCSVGGLKKLIRWTNTCTIKCKMIHRCITEWWWLSRTILT